jgi:hypothetical protein
MLLAVLSSELSTPCPLPLPKLLDMASADFDHRGNSNGKEDSEVATLDEGRRWHVENARARENKNKRGRS